MSGDPGPASPSLGQLESGGPGQHRGGHVRSTQPRAPVGEEGKFTFQVLGSQENGTEMVLLDQVADLGRDLRAIPSHNEHLPNSPAEEAAKHVSNGTAQQQTTPGTYQSRSSHSGSSSGSDVAAMVDTGGLLLLSGAGCCCGRGRRCCHVIAGIAVPGPGLGAWLRRAGEAKRHRLQRRMNRQETFPDDAGCAFC